MSSSDTPWRPRWVPIFFGIAACSWMPHWSCHYYRLETGSSFVVGMWEFSPFASLMHMALYTLLIGLNLGAIGFEPIRPLAALGSGIVHTLIGVLHALRLWRPFRFEVIGHPWPLSASAREVAIVLGFGLVCFVVAGWTRNPA